MKSTDMPSPDTVLEYPNGNIGLAMFYYEMPEDTDAEAVARENGFESEFVYLENDEREEAVKLFEEYENGSDGQVISNRWNPEVPDGWTFAGANDTEDGPIAMFVRRLTPKNKE